MGNAFSSQEEDTLIKVVSWNEEHLMGFEICLLRSESHLYVSLAGVY
jgi:hypothetical protein